MQMFPQNKFPLHCPSATQDDVIDLKTYTQAKGLFFFPYSRIGANYHPLYETERKKERKKVMQIVCVCYGIFVKRAILRCSEVK